MTQFLKDWQPWLISAGILIGAVILARIVHAVIFAAGRRIAKKSGNTLDDSVVKHSNRPVRAILPLLALSLALPATYLPSNWEDPIQHLVVLGMIASIAWLLVSFVSVFEDVISQTYRVDVADNLRARKLQTQVQVGGREMLLDDARRFADRMRLSESSVELQVWRGQIHVFQAMFRLLPEAPAAISSGGKFLSRSASLS